MKLWVSVSEYAAIYAVSRTTVYKWMEAGLLDVIHVERVVRLRNQPPTVRACPSCQVAPTTSHASLP